MNYKGQSQSQQHKVIMKITVTFYEVQSVQSFGFNLQTSSRLVNGISSLPFAANHPSHYEICAKFSDEWLHNKIISGLRIKLIERID